MVDSLKPTKYQLLLASNSPRRRELLKMIDPDFVIAEMHDIDETYPESLPLEEVSKYLSQLKAKAYASQLVENEIIITADTVVINNCIILGKPHSEHEAVDMLMSLMGHDHEVVTGVTLTSIDKTVSFSETTIVTFDNIGKEEIQAYVENYRPYDKAGAYGIQEWIGGVGIIGVKGCFYNVMGLPVHALFRHLRAF